ncbi:MAG: PHP domain-containing protein [Gammaproteobacteria bacterium]|nr:PHP domain-containing protein [Gammaproteobacteria bacterium]
MIIDLHCHTNISDGTLSPKELANRAVERGVKVLALTDHDATGGLALLQNEITQNNLDLQLISGVEISTCWENKDIHIVGLNFDHNAPAMVEYLQQQDTIRELRAIEIGRRLAKTKNIEGVYDGAKDIAGQAQITRSHIAKYLIKIGVVKDNASAFKKLLARGQAGYVPSPWPSMASAIAVIQQCGGHAVLAHPLGYKLTGKWTRRLVVAFKAAGGDAMEVAGCQLAPAQRSLLGQYCLEYDLMASIGSDFHFPASWIELGRNLYLPKDVTPVWQSWSLSAESH